MLAIVGMHPIEGVERLTFGATDLLLDFTVVAGYLTDSRSLTIVAFPNQDDHAKHVEAVAEDDIIPILLNRSLMPIRKSMRVWPGERIASTTLTNSTSTPSPVVLTMRPWCSEILGINQLGAQRLQPREGAFLVRCPSDADSQGSQRGGGSVPSRVDHRALEVSSSTTPRLTAVGY
jgi:hypothetical protein